MAIFRVEIKDEDLTKLKHKGYTDEEIVMLIIEGIPIAFSRAAEQLEAKKNGGEIDPDNPSPDKLGNKLDFNKWLDNLP